MQFAFTVWMALVNLVKFIARILEFLEGSGATAGEVSHS